MTSEPRTAGPTAAESAEVARLCAQFGEGLHAMAQPLTVLRSAVITAIAPKVSLEDQRRYLEISAQQVEGACQLFESLRELVFAWQNAADCQLIDLSQLLASVCEAQGKVLRQSGVELAVNVPNSQPLILGDKDRTLQSLFALLKIAASVSLAGHLIEILVTPRGCTTELVLQNVCGQGKNLKSPARLTLALAEANIRSQRGDFQFVEDPFRIIFTLPAQDNSTVKTENAQSGTASFR